MQHGQISYAKVRALTRVAMPDNEQSPDGTVQFLAPDGHPIDAGPQPLPDASIPTLGPHPPPPVNHGTPFDVAWAIDVLWRPRT